MSPGAPRAFPPVPDPDPAWFVRPNGSDGSRGIHGISHTRRVIIHVREISEALDVPALVREAASLAALWHDIGRTDDGADYYHGAKSAGKVVGLGLHRDFPLAQVELALYAVTHHSGSEDHGRLAAARLPHPKVALRVFEVLKDADGLDRVRLGDLDPTMLRLPGSAQRESRAWQLLDLHP